MGNDTGITTTSFLCAEVVHQGAMEALDSSLLLPATQYSRGKRLNNSNRLENIMGAVSLWLSLMTINSWMHLTLLPMWTFAADIAGRFD